MFETWRRRIIIFLCMVIAFLAVGIIYTFLKNEREIPQWAINGVVQKVKYYDARGEPEITVNGKTYYLESRHWNIPFGIDRGDSIIKIKGSMEIKLIKHKSGNIINVKL
jgi:hypothetical protein